MIDCDMLRRRTVLGSIASSVVAGTAGCLDSVSGGSEKTDPFVNVFIDGLDLVVELEPDRGVDRVNVVDPNSELFAKREIPTGVEQVQYALGVDYPGGEYDVIAVSNDEEIGRSSLSIESEIQITDLKLGRNHPDEMFDRARDSDIRSEVILTVENIGTGPDAVTSLEFSGDVPYPTPDDSGGSRIEDTESEMTAHADSVTVQGGQQEVLYSKARPFSHLGGNIECSPDTTEGKFSISMRTKRSSSDISATYAVEYTGESMADCDISIKPTE